MSRYHRLFDLRLGGRSRVAAEMDQEIEAHIAMRMADLMRDGISEADARREAERRFGDLERARAKLHAAARQRDAAMRQRDWWGSIMSDVRYAGRQARRAPGFTALAIFTLALGIGATTTIFSLVEHVLLRPLPFPHSERLMRLTGRDSAGNTVPNVSSADWLDWRAAKSLTNSAIYYRPYRIGIVAGDSALRVDVTRTTADFFKVLEARFLVGRPYDSTDLEGATGTPVVVSERLWRTVLGGDPTLSRPLRTASRSFPVAGVVAQGQAYPADADVWIPESVRPRDGEARTWINYFAIARLPSAASADRAAAEMSSIARAIRADQPAALYDYGVGVQPLGEALVGDSGSYLKMLMGAVTVVLLIVCANIASSGLARASTRGREMAVRTSLGAARPRLVRQLLIEHTCLGLAGGALGIALAWSATRVIVARWGEMIPRSTEIRIDGPILAFAVVLSVLAGVVAGVLPALRGSRVSLTSMFANGSRTAARGGRNIAGASLVSLEIALAVLLLTGAGLLIRSFRSVLSRDLGFQTNVATMEIALSGPRYDRDTAQHYVYWDGLVDALRRVPGVESVGLSQWIPLGSTGAGFIDIPGRALPKATAVYRTVSADFFRTLGMPLIVGRTFDASDAASTPRVVVINRAMAQRYWAGDNPVGKQVRARSMEPRIDGRPADWLTVIGVVADIRSFGLEAETRPEMYVYFRQTPGWSNGMTALVRASRPAPKILGELRRAASTVDAHVAMDLGTLDERLSGTLAARTLTMSLLSAFATMAVILATLGVYGVLSYAVAQRTRELAVRAALGAQRAQLLWLVFSAGGRVLTVGAAAGVLASFALTRTLESMLVDVTAIDPATMAVALGVLMCAAFAAVLVPALRATRLDPMLALQAE